MVTKSYLPSYLCDSSDGSDINHSSDSSDSRDSCDSSDQQTLVTKTIVHANCFCQQQQKISNKILFS